MAIAFRFAAHSDVGRVRSKNDDSAYAGRFLAVVADGMGGHVGGDVASASAVVDLTHLDHPHHQGEARTVLVDEIQNANQNLAKLVQANPRLSGMGTTVTALLIDQDEMVLAHIGDSRAYLLDQQGFRQVTTDHTFVQRLIDEGRLRPEEADTHPHKNVLMRVLGDVDASPELEMHVLTPQVGDRWLLCSDGLNAVLDPELIEQVVRSTGDLDQIARTLVEMTLDRGAPDNVTVVVVQVLDTDDVPRRPGHAEDLYDEDGIGVNDLNLTSAFDHSDPVDAVRDDPTRTPVESSAAALRRDLAERPHVMVGAAQNATQTGRIPAVTDRLVQRRATLVRTENQSDLPEADEVRHALSSPGAPTRRPLSRSVALWVGLVLGGLLVALGGWTARAWIGEQYYVGDEGGKVAVYNGIPQSLGPLKFGEIHEVTDLPVERLAEHSRQLVEETIPAQDLPDAERIVADLRASAAPSPQPVPTGTIDTGTASPSPSDPARNSASPTPGPGAVSEAPAPASDVQQLPVSEPAAGGGRP